MREFDLLGVQLADFQGRIFESSLLLNISTPIFLRRFKNSKVANEIDNLKGVTWTLDELEAIQNINEEFSDANYGNNKYDKDVLYWMGYILRYISYTRNISTKKLFSLISYEKLNSMYYAYHTQGEEYVAESIFEIFNINESIFDSNNKFKEQIRKQILANI